MMMFTPERHLPTSGQHGPAPSGTPRPAQSVQYSIFSRPPGGIWAVSTRTDFSALARPRRLTRASTSMPMSMGRLPLPSSSLLRRHLSTATPTGPPGAPPSLEGQFAWVVGGVGIVGAGICRGLLRAGATVLVNSRHELRLEQLSEELERPERLIVVPGSMLPEHAASTVAAGMERTGNQLNHVRTATIPSPPQTCPYLAQLCFPVSTHRSSLTAPSAGGLATTATSRRSCATPAPCSTFRPRNSRPSPRSSPASTSPPPTT